MKVRMKKQKRNKKGSHKRNFVAEKKQEVNKFQ